MPPLLAGPHGPIRVGRVSDPIATVAGLPGVAEVTALARVSVDRVPGHRTARR